MFALPGLEHENDPQEKHIERGQNSCEEQSDRSDEVGEKQSYQSCNQKDSPQENALPGVKTDE